jgi:hypothetical protein
LRVAAWSRIRFLREELGVDEKDVKLGAQLAERSQNHAVGGREVCQIERYFPVRVTAADVGPARTTQTENIRDRRWWTLDELRAPRCRRPESFPEPGPDPRDVRGRRYPAVALLPCQASRTRRDFRNTP